MTEKTKVESLEIITRMIKDKPYYEIKYKEVGKSYYNIGYSSYNLENVLKWKEECFEIVDEQLAECPEELKQYRAIGTVEELLNTVKEEDVLKFYYCENEDSYLVGIRIGNFYYAHWDGKRFIFDMSRYLPWGEHVVNEKTAWKEYTYPSEPKEIDFSSWLQGFIRKECRGTIEECREAVKKQKAKLVIDNTPTEGDVWYQCPTCKGDLTTIRGFYCQYCGQKLHWR